MFDFASSEELRARAEAEEEAEEEDTRDALTRMSEVVDTLKRRAGKAALSVEQVILAMEDDGLIAVDLAEDIEVDAKLQENERIERTMDEEGEVVYAFKTTFEDVTDRTSLKGRIDRSTGVSAKALGECYAEAKEDIEVLIVTGQVLAHQNATTNDVVLFPRKGQYLVELSARAIGSKLVDDKCSLVTISKEVTAEIRRGDAVRVGGEWRRVSSRVNRGGHQPKRAERPLSVSSVQDMHSANEYVDPFEGDEMSLVPSLDTRPPEGVSLVKFGCTNDVRAAWLETAALLPSDKDMLARALVAADLDHVSMLSQRRPTKSASSKKSDDGDERKPKKRRYNRGYHKITNTHLVGTEIGDILAAADERTNNNSKPADDKKKKKKKEEEIKKKKKAPASGSDDDYEEEGAAAAAAAAGAS